MAVITPITDDEARDLTREYGLGPLQRVEGIPAGSVNSNFALELTGRRVFLRIYEEQDVAGADRETEMLERLAAAGVPTPAPLHRLDGRLVSDVRGKAAAIFPWRGGSMRCQASVTAEDTRSVGQALARVHVAGANEVAPVGRFRLEDLRIRLDAIAASPMGLASMAPVLRQALEDAHIRRDEGLPRGLIHGDLFRDNVLWQTGGSISALLDFESACEGTYAYDLMVCVLSWCFGDDLQGGLAVAMCEGYESVRRLAPRELRALADEGTFAALRFVITRMTDYSMRSVAGPRVIKDWRRFMKRFERLRSLGSDGLLRMLARA